LTDSKWSVCGASAGEKLRFEKLQEQLTSVAELHFSDWENSANWNRKFEGFKLVRWGEEHQPELAKLFNVQSSWIALLGVTDGMVYRDRRWWPLCGAFEALCLTLLDLGKSLDPSGSAFISGGGSMARAAIAALFKCGFRKFFLAGVSDNLQFVEDIKVKFFGISIEIVPTERVVVLAGVSSIFVNTLTDQMGAQLSEELAYLNFLKRPGAVVDTAMSGVESVLLTESRGANIPTVDGYEIAARVDELWVEWAFGMKLDRKLYLKRLRS
jgi:hypothetical protein